MENKEEKKEVDNQPKKEETTKSVDKPQSIVDKNIEVDKLNQELAETKRENQWYKYMEKNGNDIPNENKPVIKELNIGMKGSFEENMVAINKKFPHLFKKSNKSFTVIDKENSKAEKPKSEEKRNAEKALNILNRK